MAFIIYLETEAWDQCAFLAVIHLIVSLIKLVIIVYVKSINLAQL